MSITNSTITGSAFDNADISDASGTLNLTVTDTTFSSGGGPNVGGSGLLVGADGTISVTGSTFTDNDIDAFAFGGSPAAPGTDSVTFSNNTVDSDGNGGVAITLYGNATNAIAVDGNNIQNAGGDAIAIDQVEGQYIPTGSGILTGTIDGNTIADPNEGIYGWDGTQICGGGRGCYSGPGGTVCAVITGNSIAGSGPADIELDQNDAYTINLPGYTGGPDDVSAVESFLAGNNDGDGTPTAVATVSGSGGGFVGASNC